MTSGRRPRPAITLIAVVVAALFILSGIRGITGGGTTAQVGWLLVAVGILGLLLVAVELVRR